jgi:hypothetical protein
MTQEFKQKREELKAISAPFKILIKEGAIGSINEGLANYYREQGHLQLNSYKRWQEQGFQVKKGSKALLMWGEPAPLKKSGATTTPTGTPKKEGEEDTFFPLAYVFSNLQVEPIETQLMKR